MTPHMPFSSLAALYSYSRCKRYKIDIFIRGLVYDIQLATPGANGLVVEKLRKMVNIPPQLALVQNM